MFIGSEEAVCPVLIPKAHFMNIPGRVVWVLGLSGRRNVLRQGVVREGERGREGDQVRNGCERLGLGLEGVGNASP